MKLRKLQSDIHFEYLRQTKNQDYHDVLIHAVSGGGKSKCPIIAFHTLKRKNPVDKLCIAVPRDSSKEQFARSALEGIDLYGRRIICELNESTNEIDPSRGTDGYITTYQALAADRSQINAFEFKRFRYLLALDECHHVGVGSSFEKGLTPLIESSSHRLFMTGTLERGDHRPIAFLPYESIDGGDADAIQN